MKGEIKSNTNISFNIIAFSLFLWFILIIVNNIVKFSSLEPRNVLVIAFRLMKKFVFSVCCLCLVSAAANAQISEAERAKLTSTQQKIYDSGTSNIKQAREAEDYKHKVKKELASEMEKEAKFAGPAHKIIEDERHEKEVEKLDKEQELWDKAAREAIKNNEKDD